VTHWIDPPAADLGQVAYDARMTDATPWENLSERERDGWRTLANAVAQAAEARRAALAPCWPGPDGTAFVIDAHRRGALSEGEAVALTRLDRLDVRGLVHERGGYDDTDGGHQP
jgi:hypothetical protein